MALATMLALAGVAAGCGGGHSGGGLRGADQAASDIDRANSSDPCWNVGYDAYSWDTNVNTGEVRPDDEVPGWPDPGSDNWRPSTDAEIQGMLDDQYPGCNVKDLSP